MLKTEEIEARAARYNRVEREADSLGRVIGVKKLKPSQQMRVEEMTVGLSGSTDMVGENGEMIQMPRRAPYLIAASVVDVDGNPVPFAKTRDALDAILDMLDAEGIEAAGKALAKFSEEPADTVSAAKNS